MDCHARTVLRESRFFCPLSDAILSINIIGCFNRCRSRSAVATDGDYGIAKERAQQLSTLIVKIKPGVSEI